MFVLVVVWVVSCALCGMGGSTTGFWIGVWIGVLSVHIDYKIFPIKLWCLSLAHSDICKGDESVALMSTLVFRSQYQYF